MTLTIIPFLPFELGESNLARKVVENYKKYESTGEYTYLKECFASLCFIVEKHPEKKIVAVNACDAIARKTYDLYKNFYIKAFIANSADSIFRQAQLQPNQYWTEECRLNGQMMKRNGFDPLEAAKAGFVQLPSIEEAKARGFVTIKV